MRGLFGLCQMNRDICMPDIISVVRCIYTVDCLVMVAGDDNVAFIIIIITITIPIHTHSNRT